MKSRVAANGTPGLNEASTQGNLNPTTLLFENLWLIEDVARYTGYSVGTLYNLTSQKIIPHRKKRGKLYFVPLEIQNWIEEGDL